MKHEAQVVLYRSYRRGDLPDIQIPHSSLITPLQAVAQVSARLAHALGQLPRVGAGVTCPPCVGFSLVAVGRLLIAVASLAAEHGL